jgi:hypothetical protein
LEGVAGGRIRHKLASDIGILHYVPVIDTIRAILREPFVMFTPEFAARDDSEFHLVANHYLETEDARLLSVEFVRHRVRFGTQNVPNPDAKFVVHYDVRGQDISGDIEERLRAALAGVCEVRVKRI